jgi:hypothetical protein
MKSKSNWRPRLKKMFVVAPVTSTTWAVAFARQIIPGAVFTSQAAAVLYAFILASGAGLDGSSVKILEPA